MGRRRHDDAARAVAQALATAEQNRREQCLERWPGIVAAMNRLVAAYNEGAGEPLLIANEHSEGNDPGITIASHGLTPSAITVAVDGDALLVQAKPATGLHGLARRIDCSRSDLGTAAYLLQDWMDQL